MHSSIFHDRILIIMCKVPIKKSFCYDKGLHIDTCTSIIHIIITSLVLISLSFGGFFLLKLCFILSKTLNFKATDRITE